MRVVAAVLLSLFLVHPSRTMRGDGTRDSRNLPPGLREGNACGVGVRPGRGSASNWRLTSDAGNPRRETWNPISLVAVREEVKFSFPLHFQSKVKEKLLGSGKVNDDYPHMICSLNLHNLISLLRLKWENVCTHRSPTSFVVAASSVGASRGPTPFWSYPASTATFTSSSEPVPETA